MDQDFHYYGTYYAARTGGFDTNEATLIAKASNFIDFFNETTYAAYWKLVSQTQKSDNYDVVNQLDYPRYTFQGGFLSTLASPEDGLWCSYHFTPGNYDDPPNTPSRETVHGQAVANYLPQFKTRDTTQGRAILEKYYPEFLDDLKFGKLLNRPQSALSRQLIVDTLKCAASDARLASILGYAIGGQAIFQNNREDTLRRFRLILLGIRAHVIADTWAHQDFCGLNNVLNTYWDVDYDPTSWNPAKWGYGRQSIEYDDGTTSGWRNQVLSAAGKIGLISQNFEAVPNGTSYLGHGWMGHLPDFSFIKFRYKPCWADPSKGAIERNNPEEYQRAWVELVSLFTQAKGNGPLTLDEEFQHNLAKAAQAIQIPCHLADSGTGRKSSANAWQTIFRDPPSTNIDADAEPDSNAVLVGMIEMTKSLDRYGTNYININSDLYLFQIAADYHFHFVKDYLERHGIYRFAGSWSQQRSALSPEVSSLFGSEGDPTQELPTIRLKVFHETGTTAAHPEVTLTVPSEYKILSGGARVNWTGNGNLLTASFPKDSNTWVAKAKDHRVSSPANIDVWAIAIYDPHSDWKVDIVDQISSAASHPSVSATVPDGYVLTGGGAESHWKSKGSLLTASYPDSRKPGTWTVASKDHLDAETTTITAYAVGLRAVNGAKGLSTKVVTNISAAASHPSTEVSPERGYSLIGGGAQVNYTGKGNLLIASYPDFDNHKWMVASKDHGDHGEFDPSTITAYAIGLKTT